MARITVEDCIKLINNQYDLVILAKERAVQLGRGATPSVDPENDKKPVIALREISESKITADELKESIIAKLRQIPDYEEEEELEEVKIVKGLGKLLKGFKTRKLFLFRH